MKGAKVNVEKLIYNLGIATVSDYTCNKLPVLHGMIQI